MTSTDDETKDQAPEQRPTAAERVTRVIGAPTSDYTPDKG